MTTSTPSGVITITTDFGHKGPFAAVMKGVILTRFSQARIIDLAHDIPPHWPPEAGFWISRSYRYFPKGTVHVAIVDPGVGTEREIIVAEHDEHIFMAPDNGLLAPLLTDNSSAKVFCLDVPGLRRHGIAAPSLTFHGRDIFAPVAAELASGRLAAKDIARPTTQWTPGWLEDPVVSKDRVSGMIVTVDAFGNLISNIDASLVERFDRPVAAIAGHCFAMMPTYGRVKPGDYLALINSFGVLEIARAEGSAAEGLGTDRGAPVVVRESE
ncbi:MAG: SAM-dependent chlorinase/fluorinase [Gammaproteobacteria bacterium]|nr:SAM-dependent chlorinase/fluorinase [Gammaproteobacteria bacterium]MDH4313853.1 SAM-dependent chlorinase/fluorinase [Gammaproteobacteria bacterium]MDH5213669.1 SAM-dependent chlorinase/fluorinase [Gammaproteobacteria bacterium]MDH5500445.1 SAM-dependent chlorinase/fluorinase [Gammaproteobacteria bacterium]